VHGSSVLDALVGPLCSVNGASLREESRKPDLNRNLVLAWAKPSKTTKPNCLAHSALWSVCTVPVHDAHRQAAILNLREILVEWILHLIGSDGTPARESSIKPLDVDLKCVTVQCCIRTVVLSSTALFWELYMINGVQLVSLDLSIYALLPLPT
jgi:hypothetical protein